MSALSNDAETKLLQLIFEAATWTGMATAVAGNLNFALYNTDPTDADSGTEVTYTGYARVTVARGTANFTVTGDTVTNDVDITFGLCTAGSDTANYGAVYDGTTNLVAHGALSSALAISANVRPRIPAGSFTATAA